MVTSVLYHIWLIFYLILTQISSPLLFTVESTAYNVMGTSSSVLASLRLPVTSFHFFNRQSFSPASLVFAVPSLCHLLSRCKGSFGPKTVFFHTIVPILFSCLVAGTCMSHPSNLFDLIGIVLVHSPRHWGGSKIWIDWLKRMARKSP